MSTFKCGLLMFFSWSGPQPLVIELPFTQVVKLFANEPQFRLVELPGLPHLSLILPLTAGLRLPATVLSLLSTKWRAGDQTSTGTSSSTPKAYKKQRKRGEINDNPTW